MKIVGNSDVLKINQSQAKISSEGNFSEILKEKINTENDGLVSLGVLNKNNPTVSNLLINNSKYKNECWEIIHNSINKKKSFTRIYSETEILINKKTSELSWKNSEKNATEKIAVNQYLKKQTPEKSLVSIKKDKDDSTINKLTKNFESAVKSCIGTKYKDLDCYELLVSGMEKLGVKYRGKGGLSEYLSTQALNKGLPSNSFKTGEGIIELSGTKSFTKTIPAHKIKNYSGEEILNEISPYLRRGDILSFSTQGRGHTGIISKDKNEWTFVNSGFLDNITDKTFIKKGVGEESLQKEFDNWLKLASRRMEALMISTGRLDNNKLSRFVIEQKAKETLT